MTYVLELEPGQFEGHRFDHNSVEGSLYDTFGSYCSNALAVMLVQPDFLASEVPDAFINAIDEASPKIVLTKLDSEKSWHNEEFKPVTRKVGELITQEVITKPEDIVINQEFIDDIKQQINNLPYDFSELEDLHDVYETNKSLSLVREVWQLTIDKPDGWLDQAYDLAKRAMLNPEYTLPLDSPEALYLICHLPHLPRQLTRRVLVNNFMAAKVESAIGSDSDEYTAAALTAFKHYLAIDALEGQHWRDAADYYGMSEETKLEMLLQGADRLDLLGQLQNLADQGKISKFQQVYQRTIKKLDRITDVMNANSDVGEWQMEDIGHCFHGFWDHSLFEVFSINRLAIREYALPVKNGSQALILEDNNVQRTMWQRSVNDHTAYEAPDELVLTDPTAVETYITNPNIGLFILDVQNGDDKLAGIRVAETLIRLKLSQIEVSDNPDSLPETKIVVWSDSNESVKTAKAILSEMIAREHLDPEIRQYVHFNSSGAQLPLDVQVQRKSWYNFDIPKRPRQTD